MATYRRGKINFESKRLGIESGRYVAMFEIDCVPPPNGMEKTFTYEKEIGPMIQQRFMQATELNATLTGAANPGETIDSARLLTDLAQNFNFAKLTIDEKNLPPGWRNGERCYTVTVSYIVDYFVWEIKAVAAEEFRSGNETYPKDDMVASFRIMVPHLYDFNRSYKWNPECCSETPQRRTSDTAGPFPKLNIFEWDVPDKWKFKPKWGLELKGEYNYKKDKEPPKEGGD